MIDEREKPFKKDDKGKPELMMLFDMPLAITKVVEGLMHGAIKYGRRNWRKMSSRSRYLNAPLRHIMAYCGGQKIDPDSGVPHLALAIDSLLFVLQLDEEDAVIVTPSAQLKQALGEARDRAKNAATVEEVNKAYEYTKSTMTMDLRGGNTNDE